MDQDARQSEFRAYVRADAVEIQSVRDGAIRTIKAKREIILACGALRTPQLLILRYYWNFQKDL